MTQFRRALRYCLRTIVITFAVLYFLIDLIFLGILRPLRRWFMALYLVQRLRAWVETLNRYPALCLLVVPWLILEPAKPIAFLLFAHKHHLSATLVIVGSEIAKLTLLEQIFEMTKPKLLTFGWFAWGYGRWQAAMMYMRALPVWRMMLSWYRTMRVSVRQWLHFAR